MKNLVLQLNAKMLLSNQIAGFLIFNISETWKYKVYFLHAVTYLLKLQIDDIISIYKEVIKTLRSQKLKEV